MILPSFPQGIIFIPANSYLESSHYNDPVCFIWIGKFKPPSTNLCFIEADLVKGAYLKVLQLNSLKANCKLKAMSNPIYKSKYVCVHESVYMAAQRQGGNHGVN